MKKVSSRIIFLMLILSSDLCFSQSGWTEQESGTDDSLRSVMFINSFTGWIAGTNGVILKTTTGGIFWNKMNTGISNDLYSVCFTASDSVLFASGDSGLIIKSANSGINWSVLNTGVSSRLTSVCFPDASTGYVSGFNGIVLKTTNSGINWNNLNSGTNIQLNSVFFTDPLKGWTAGYGGIFNTINGGLSWSPQFIDGYLVLNSIFFTDSLHGWSAYYDNISFGPENIRTTTGGLDWRNYSMDNSYSISVFFIDANTGWSSGYYGKLNYSTDGGTSWVSQKSSTIEHLNSVYFTDSHTGWVAGNSGKILKTTTGGIITGFTNDEVVSPGNFKIEQNFPNPFNPSTVISYELHSPSFISLIVYNVLGDKVSVLVNEFMDIGNHKVNFDASDLPAGIYYYRISSGKYSQTKKLVFLK